MEATRKKKPSKATENTSQDQEEDSQEEEEERPEFNLILKADTAGTLEAVIQNAIHEEVTLVMSGVGPSPNQTYSWPNPLMP